MALTQEAVLHFIRIRWTVSVSHERCRFTPIWLAAVPFAFQGTLPLDRATEALSNEPVCHAEQAIIRRDWVNIPFRTRFVHSQCSASLLLMTSRFSAILRLKNCLVEGSKRESKPMPANTRVGFGDRCATWCAIGIPSGSHSRPPMIGRKPLTHDRKVS